MPTQDTSKTLFSDEDVAVLARYAGLTVSDERLPLITRELNIAQQAAGDLLSPQSIDIAGVTHRFDPAWPEPPKRRGAR